MRIESSSLSPRLGVNANTPKSSSRVSNNTRDTISDSKSEEACANLAVAMVLFFAVGCAFLFAIFDFIKQWVQMKR